MALRVRVVVAVLALGLDTFSPVAAQAAQRVNCKDTKALGTMFEDINEKCCNGGRGAVASAARRALGESSTCALSTCTPACAKLFVRVMQDCQSTLQSNAGAFSFLSHIKGATSFLSTCQKVLRPRPTVGTHWVHVGTQFIAADPGMRSHALTHGTGARAWGLWRTDPGSTGVQFSGIPALEKRGAAPSGWKFDPNAWWVEEHGLIMENPAPLPAGRYQVSWLNYRQGYVPTVVLSISGDGWSLSNGATLHDVTHMPCRSARYTTQPGTGVKCLPEHVPKSLFPVTPGAVMPAVPHCNKKDYAVLFVSAYWG